MKTFKEGDRVNHPKHGAGTVVNSYGRWTTVQYDDGHKLYTDIDLLSPVPEPTPKPSKFKIGDRVSHKHHRDGTVDEIHDNGVHTVHLGGDRVYMALEHQISHAVTEPKFTVQVMFTNGEGINSEIPMYQPTAQTYLTDISNWDNVESITITRAKG